MQSPTPPRKPVTTTQFGRTRTDHYAWMKDDNWQEVLQHPEKLKHEIAQHLTNENIYAEFMLRDVQTVREALLAEMIGRTPEADESVAWPDGQWEYASRFESGSEYPLFFRRETGGLREQVLLDANTEAKQHSYFALSEVLHAANHRYFAYAVDTQGSEIYRIVITDAETGHAVAPDIEGSTGHFVLSADSLWIYWIWRDDHGRPRKIFRRAIHGGADVLIFEETNPGYFLTIHESLSREWIFIVRGDHDTNETLLLPSTGLTETPRVFRPERPGITYHVTHWNDHFMVLTNENAIDFKIMRTPVASASWHDWEVYLPMQPGHFISGLSACEKHLAWSERVDGNVVIRHVPYGIDSDVRLQSHIIKPDEAAFDLTLLGCLEYRSSQLRYVFASPATPPHWYDYDMATGTQALRKTRRVPSGHDPSNYKVERLFATATDGTQVPITVLAKSDMRRDGAAPLLLYGYGSYGIPIDADFSITALSLVDRGWIYAIAHIRGGSDKGWTWFLDGRGEKKKNTFTDFLSCARHLIHENYATKGRIVAQGASAGGLLMGAVANMDPDLFAGIAAQVPFVDMLNTMSDASLPLTPPEWPEWGNPLKDEAAYERIASYSPYDNISERAYPPILATGGLTDPRVTYWEPAKWIAKLRDVAQGGPFMCKINMGAGHGGASGRYRRLEDVAYIFGFAIWAVARTDDPTLSKG